MRVIQENSSHLLCLLLYLSSVSQSAFADPAFVLAVFGFFATQIITNAFTEFSGSVSLYFSQKYNIKNVNCKMFNTNVGHDYRFYLCSLLTTFPYFVPINKNVLQLC